MGGLETSTVYQDQGDDPVYVQNGSQSSLNISPHELLGRTYLREPEENGERFRATIVKQITEMDEANK